MLEGINTKEELKEYFLSGQVLLLDKPLTWTSFDVVKKIRNSIKIKKVGHAGTLDPLATGLLIVCTGKKTKTIDGIQAQFKEYTGIIEIGKTTPSYDLETEFDTESDISHLNESDIRAAVQPFLGVIEQTPPMHSAIKVNGQRVYELARQGKTIELKKRQVTIHEFELTKIELPEVHFKIQCTKGTYIRSIANDFGKELGVGGHLKALIRTKIGDFTVEDAMSVDEVIEKIKSVTE